MRVWKLDWSKDYPNQKVKKNSVIYYIGEQMLSTLKTSVHQRLMIHTFIILFYLTEFLLYSKHYPKQKKFNNEQNSQKSVLCCQHFQGTEGGKETIHKNVTFSVVKFY
jgi:hypothetical protein